MYRQSKGESDWGDTYLFYEKSETKWKRATEAKEGASALNLSRSAHLRLKFSFLGVAVEEVY